MRFCSYRTPERTSYGLELPDGSIFDLPSNLAGADLPDLPDGLVQAPDLKSWLSYGEASIEAASRLREAAASGRLPSRASVLDPGRVEFLPPIPNPGKIIAIGLNYRDHAAEQNAPLPQAPLIFAKFPTALLGHERLIRLPAISQKVDVEAELCVVIAGQGKRLTEDQARRSIAGYMVGNDVSARDLQFADKQWVRGKSCDTFAPCGPFLVTPDELDDPHNLSIELRLNGRVQQDSNTRELVFNSYALLAYISQAITLETGDIIFTGTPAGVGVFRNPPVFLKSGDLVEVTIEGIGTLRNRVA